MNHVGCSERIYQKDIHQHNRDHKIMQIKLNASAKYNISRKLVLCHVMILGYRGANRIMYRRFNDLGYPNL